MLLKSNVFRLSIGGMMHMEISVAHNLAPARFHQQGIGEEDMPMRNQIQGTTVSEWRVEFNSLACIAVRGDGSTGEALSPQGMSQFRLAVMDGLLCARDHRQGREKLRPRTVTSPGALRSRVCPLYTDRNSPRPLQFGHEPSNGNASKTKGKVMRAGQKTIRKPYRGNSTSIWSAMSRRRPQNLRSDLSFCRTRLPISRKVVCPGSSRRGFCYRSQHPACPER